MLIEDTKNDTLGLESYFEGNEIYFIYPIVDMKQGLKYYLEHGIN
jgi:hypothetical protein